MKPLRTVVFWLHLLSGVTAGAVILVMSATGAVLALKPQIQNWIERDVRFVAPQPARLGAQRLLAAVKEARPDSSPQSLTIARDPSTAAIVGSAQGNLYVNPYTGAIIGSGSTRTTEFFQWITNWHRYLAATGEYRATGRSVTGVSNFAFLILSITGLYIWWPKQFTRKGLKPIVWFRRTSTGRARDFNWHNTIGFWCLMPIVIMTISGVVMSYPWANDLVYRLSGSPVPVRGGGPRVPQREPAAPVVPAGLDRIWTRAEAQVPSWSLLSMRLPTRDGAAVAFTITDGANWNAFARSNLTLNSASGEVVQWQPYANNNLGQKIRGWLRFAHTGELGGLAGQIIAGLGCLGGVFLVYTGLALACRRLWNWSVWSRVGIARLREGKNEMSAFRRSAGVVLLAGATLWANAPVRTQTRELGVLLMAHGGSPAWNATVDELRARVNERVPTEVAFGMATRAAIQSAVDRLIERGVREIVGVPLFISSHSSVVESTRYLLGARAEAPADLALFARMSHGAPTAAAGAHAEHAAMEDGTRPVGSRVPIRVTGALDDHPIVAEILLSRAKAISRDPAREAVLIVAHGPVPDADNALWLADMGRLAAHLRSSAPFAQVEAITVRDDAPPPVRAAAAAELRAAVSRLSAGGTRVLVVPLLLSYGGIEGGIKERLDGLDYTMASQAIMPDDRLVQWVLDAVKRESR